MVLGSKESERCREGGAEGWRRGVMFEECERDVGKTDIERLASNDILESVQCKRSHAIGTAQRLYKEKYIIINLMIQTLKHI